MLILWGTISKKSYNYRHLVLDFTILDCFFFFFFYTIWECWIQISYCKNKIIFELLTQKISSIQLFDHVSSTNCKQVIYRKYKFVNHLDFSLLMSRHLGFCDLNGFQIQKGSNTQEPDLKICLSSLFEFLFCANNIEVTSINCYFGSHFVFSYLALKTKNIECHPADLDSAHPNCVKNTGWQNLTQNACSCKIFRNRALTIPLPKAASVREAHVATFLLLRKCFL